MNDSLLIFCDGGARGNPGPAASAFVIFDSSHNLVHETSSRVGNTTNNQAEYQAVIMAIEWLVTNHLTDKKILFYLDSLLVVNQLLGKYKVKDPYLKEKHSKIKDLLRIYNLKIGSYVHIPRTQNTRADFLVNRELDRG